MDIVLAVLAVAGVSLLFFLGGVAGFIGLMCAPCKWFGRGYATRYGNPGAFWVEPREAQGAPSPLGRTTGSASRLRAVRTPGEPGDYARRKAA